MRIVFFKRKSFVFATFKLLRLDDAIVTKEAKTIVSLASFRGAITNQKNIQQMKIDGNYN